MPISKENSFEIIVFFEAINLHNHLQSVEIRWTYNQPTPCSTPASLSIAIPILPTPKSSGHKSQKTTSPQNKARFQGGSIVTIKESLWNGETRCFWSRSRVTETRIRNKTDQIFRWTTVYRSRGRGRGRCVTKRLGSSDYSWSYVAVNRS